MCRISTGLPILREMSTRCPREADIFSFCSGIHQGLCFMVFLLCTQLSGLQVFSLSLLGLCVLSREEPDLHSEEASSATSPWPQDTPFCHTESGASF